MIRRSITSRDIDSLPRLTVDENTDGSGTVHFSTFSDQIPQIMQNKMGMGRGADIL